MDFFDLQESLKFISHNGVTLNQEEQLQLTTGLQELMDASSEQNFEELQFWGKVIGIKADYFVAIGYTATGKYEFPVKSFYWASSRDFKFKAFPELNDQHAEKVNGFTELFSGDADKVLIKVEPDKVEGEEEVDGEAAEEKEIDPLASSEEEDESALIVPRNFLELDKLHYFVRSIETDCHIVPQGSYKLTTSHEVHRNEAFKGLK